MSLIEKIDDAKRAVSDEGVFSPDQIKCLHRMLDQLRSAFEHERSRARNGK